MSEPEHTLQEMREAAEREMKYLASVFSEGKYYEHSYVTKLRSMLRQALATIEGKDERIAELEHHRANKEGYCFEKADYCSHAMDDAGKADTISERDWAREERDKAEYRITELEVELARVRDAARKAFDAIGESEEINPSNEVAKLRDVATAEMIAANERYCAVLKRETKLREAIQNQCRNICTEAYTSRGKHHHDCLAYELAEGSEG